MGTSATTSTVYIHVIEDVINNVRDEFLNNAGPGESVLHELQGIWEMKMMQTGAIVGPIDRSGISKTGPGGGGPLHDLNVPYEGTEEYETPTAEMLFPPTPMATPMPTPLPGSVQTLPPGSVQTPLPGSVDNSSMYNIPTGASSDYPTPVSETGCSIESKPGRPSPYMSLPSPWMGQRQPVDVNVAYVEGRDEVDRGASHRPLTQDFFMVPSGKRKREDFVAQYNVGGFITQQDGAGVDATPEFLQESVSNNTLRYSESTTVNAQILPRAATSSLNIPQQDGPIPDPYDDMLAAPNIYNYQGVVNEDYNIASTPAPTDLQANTPAAVPQLDTGDEEDDEEPLNEDDDDDDDLDDVDDGEELNTQHLVLAQFDKVTRAKSKWKCTLKDGIMHINNKDILFNKVTGEFDF